MLRARSGDAKGELGAIGELGAETIDTASDTVTVTHKQAQGDLIQTV